MKENVCLCNNRHLVHVAKIHFQKRIDSKCVWQILCLWAMNTHPSSPKWIHCTDTFSSPFLCPFFLYFVFLILICVVYRHTWQDQDKTQTFIYVYVFSYAGWIILSKAVRSYFITTHILFTSPHALPSCLCPLLFPHSYCPSLCRSKWMCRQQRWLLSHLQGPENWLWVWLSLGLQTPGQKDLWRYRKKNLCGKPTALKNTTNVNHNMSGQGRTSQTWTSFF